MAKVKFNKIAALTLTLSMVMSSSVFASTLQPNVASNSKHYNCTSGRNDKGDCNFKTKLDGLVAAGTITQIQTDASMKLLTPIKGNDEIKTKLDSLVTSGTISQAQEDAMINSLTIH